MCSTLGGIFLIFEEETLGGKEGMFILFYGESMKGRG
jgi:hypothetical protein